MNWIFSTSFVVTTTISMFIGTFLLEFYTSRKHYKTSNLIPKLMFYNNFSYGFFSFFLFFWGLIDTFRFGIMTKEKTLLLNIYYFSKIYEYLDVILVALNKSSINLHFRIHHSTTLSLVWICIKGEFIYMPLLLINTLLHTILYWFFADILKHSLFFYKHGLKLTRFLGFSQLIIGFFVSILSVMQKIELKENFGYEIYGGILFLGYFFLFVLELIENSKNKKI